MRPPATVYRGLEGAHPMTPTLALLPCPFCRGTWVNHALFPYRSQPRLEQVSAEHGGGWRVTCYGCGVMTWNDHSQAHVVQTWNRRVVGENADCAPVDEEP